MGILNLLKKSKQASDVKESSNAAPVNNDAQATHSQTEKRTPVTSSAAKGGMMSSLLVRPIVTEKVVAGGAHCVAFEVPMDANKITIAAAVKQSFGVVAQNVRILHTRGKTKRTRQGMVFTKGFKKAYVTLPVGTEIDMTSAPK